MSVSSVTKIYTKPNLVIGTCSASNDCPLSLLWCVVVTLVVCGCHSCGVWLSLLWCVVVPLVVCGCHSCGV